MTEPPEAMDCHAGKLDCSWPACICPARPHSYVASTIHMGDCAICGHVEDDWLHKVQP